MSSTAYAQRGQRPPKFGRSAATGPVSSTSSVPAPALRAATSGTGLTAVGASTARGALVGATLLCIHKGGPVAAVARTQAVLLGAKVGNIYLRVA